jgi:lipoate-protein ligase A
VAAAVADVPFGRALAPGVTPCFAEPSAGELVIGERKLAGSAQWRSDGALLQHGSLLVGDDQSLLPALTIGAREDIPAPATLAEALGRIPSPSELAGYLSEAVRELEDPAAEELKVEPEIRARAESLVVRYQSDAWTWRR